MVDKVKVLHYVPGFDHGGIESRLIDWYKNVDREKVQFDLLKLTPDGDNPLIDAFKELGGNVYTLPKFSPKTYFIYRKKLSDFFKGNNDYNVVHCHSPSTGKFVLDKAKQYDIPLRIMHSRTTQFNKGSSFMFVRNLLKKSSFSNATDYFACSKEAGEWLFGEDIILNGKLKVINNGIEVEKFLYNEETRRNLRNQLNLGNNFVIGNVGRFSAPKNHPFMIDIFNEVCKKHSNSKLLLLGDGPEKESVMKKVNILNLKDKVLFLGRKENIEDYLQCMDVFLFPSHFEGFGTVAIEAQAAGLKTIVSDGVPSSVDVTVHIERLSLTNSAEVWADTIFKYSNGYERKSMFKEIVETGFDVKSTADFLEKYYLENS